MKLNHLLASGVIPQINDIVYLSSIKERAQIQACVTDFYKNKINMSDEFKIKEVSYSESNGYMISVFNVTLSVLINGFFYARRFTTEKSNEN